MGRTLPPYRLASEIEIRNWSHGHTGLY